MSPSLKRGDLLKIPGVDWSLSSRNIVLVLSPTCPACNENLPFYRRLALKRDIRVSVVSREPPGVTGQWLEASAIRPADVRQVEDLDALGVVLTPSLLMVAPTGEVTDIVLRKLSESDEARILQRIEDPSVPFLDNSQYISEVSLNQLESVGFESIQLLDVRSRDRFRRGHRAAALNIPLAELKDRSRIELDSQAPVVVDCLQPAGGACRAAAWTLLDSGFRNVSILIR